MQSTTTKKQKRQSDSARLYPLNMQVETYVDLSEIVDQIDKLHRKIPSVEWSGIIFYKIYDGEGNEVEEPSDIMEKNTTLKAKYILPQNKGSASYTEYQTDMETLIDLTQEYPELESCIRGHIHSHVNMGTFFSGTDNDQLKDGAFDNEVFLSVIVNQKDNVTARVSLKGKVDTSPKITFYQREVDLAEDNEDAVFYIEPKVYKIEREEEPQDFFDKQLEEICKQPTTPVNNGYGSYGGRYGGYQNPAYNRGNQHHRNNYNNTKNNGTRTQGEKTEDLKKRATNILTGLVEKSVSGSLKGTQKQKIGTAMYNVLKQDVSASFITTFYLNALERFQGMLGTSIIDDFSDLEEINDYMADELIDVATGCTPKGGIVKIEKRYETEMMTLARDLAQTLSEALDDTFEEIQIQEEGDGYNRPF